MINDAKTQDNEDLKEKKQNNHEESKQQQQQDVNENKEQLQNGAKVDQPAEMDGKEENTQEENKDQTIEKMAARIKELEKELENKDNRYLRLHADFENYKRRIRNEIEAIEKYQAQNLVMDLLPTLDNFERALKTEAKSEDAKSLLKGIEMVYRSLMEALEKAGVKPIEAVGKQFDPHYHHAVMQGKNEDYEANIVLEEFQKGYMLKDRVIRPSMVKVNQ